jgi:hypothetical protein
LKVHDFPPAIGMTPNKNAGVFLLLDLQHDQTNFKPHPDYQLCSFLEEKRAAFGYKPSQSIVRLDFVGRNWNWQSVLTEALYGFPKIA